MEVLLCLISLCCELTPHPAEPAVGSGDSISSLCVPAEIQYLSGSSGSLIHDRSCKGKRCFSPLGQTAELPDLDWSWLSSMDAPNDISSLAIHLASCLHCAHFSRSRTMHWRDTSSVTCRYAMCKCCNPQRIFMYLNGISKQENMFWS